ncbi:hypothetical protein FAES_2148 [Fibrella aestuarina BUZ 2]|uniref:Uncharacterized protein n=1 Tax=Fibrella aestuarina BUZ 2 TaxID=1166018 RepID=I0K7Q4_9BACT|nr:hypothetical protein FAES_2148 [Fibrella aestuarina BUZ 2]
MLRAGNSRGSWVRPNYPGYSRRGAPCFFIVRT